jgi:hypothetical protein
MKGKALNLERIKSNILIFKDEICDYPSVPRGSNLLRINVQRLYLR